MGLIPCPLPEARTRGGRVRERLDVSAGCSHPAGTPVAASAQQAGIRKQKAPGVGQESKTSPVVRLTTWETQNGSPALQSASEEQGVVQIWMPTPPHIVGAPGRT